MKKFVTSLLICLLFPALAAAALADGLTPQLELTAGQDCTVYAAPDALAPQGETLVSGGAFQACGLEEGWLLIQYGGGRFGYIAAPEGVDVAALNWETQSAWLTREVTLTDGVSELLTLPAGAWVTALATLDGQVYIESSTGDIVRGFVRPEDLRYDQVFELEEVAGMLTVSPEGHFTLEGELPAGASSVSLTVNGEPLLTVEW